METGLTDLQVRSIDIGKSNVQVALVHRGPLARRHDPNPSRHMISSQRSTMFLAAGGPTSPARDLIDKPAPPTRITGRSSSSTVPATTPPVFAMVRPTNSRPGDVLVIPAGTGHQFTQHRRPHHLSHGPRGPGQGGAVAGCGGVTGVLGRERRVTGRSGADRSQSNQRISRRKRRETAEVPVRRKEFRDSVRLANGRDSCVVHEGTLDSPKREADLQLAPMVCRFAEYHNRRGTQPCVHLLDSLVSG